MENRVYRIKQNQKRNMQAITMFNYYKQILFPTIFQDVGYPSHRPCKYRTVNRKIAYNYAYDSCIGEQVGHDVILQAAKSVYVSHSAIEMRQNSFFKHEIVKLKYLPISAMIQEQIDFVILTQDYNAEQFEQKSLKSSRKKISEYFGPVQTSQKPSSTLHNKKSEIQYSIDPMDYFLYVIHYSHSINKDTTQLLWQNFIQRYHFKFNREQSNEKKCRIIYEVVFAFNTDDHFLFLNPSNHLLQNYFDGLYLMPNQKEKSAILSQFQRKISHILQQQLMISNKQMQSTSFDPIHRRQLQLTELQKSLFLKLKPIGYQYFSQINKSRPPNRYFLDNLICRMMSNQNYKQEQSVEAIKYYLDFQKRMRSKYRWSDFDKYDKMNIFIFIGKDLMGRPVLLNRMRNVLCSKITDFDEFFDYHFFLFEIFLQDQMEGWVDQFSVIADASNQLADNTNLSFTKRILMEGYKVGIGRHFKIIPFDVGFLGYSIFRIVSPLMPQSLVQCFKMFGENREGLLEELRTFMPDETIPEFLGGRNPTLETKLKRQQRLDVRNNQLTSERSILLDLNRSSKR